MSKRKHLSPEQKVSIVRRHLLEGASVSDLCDEYGIYATQIYTWQKQLFENAAPIFERKKNKSNERRQEAAAEKKIAQLEEKLTTKNELLSSYCLRIHTSGRGTGIASVAGFKGTLPERQAANLWAAA